MADPKTPAPTTPPGLATDPGAPKPLRKKTGRNRDPGALEGRVATAARFPKAVAGPRALLERPPKPMVRKPAPSASANAGPVTSTLGAAAVVRVEATGDPARGAAIAPRPKAAPPPPPVELPRSPVGAVRVEVRGVDDASPQPPNATREPPSAHRWPPPRPRPLEPAPALSAEGAAHALAAAKTQKP